MLTPSESLHEDTKEEIERILPEGDTIYILGGEVAISENVAGALEDKGYEVERLAGDNRYETAVAIAEELTPNPEEAFLATGEGFADAVAASGVAAERGAPMLLTRTESLSDSTADYLVENQVEDINVIGGPAVVSEEVFEEVGATDRIAGANRWETAVEIAAEFFDSPDQAALATGWEFPDALSGGAYAAMDSAPVLLTAQDNLPTATQEYFQAQDSLERITIFGGENAVSDAIKDEL